MFNDEAVSISRFMSLWANFLGFGLSQSFNVPILKRVRFLRDSLRSFKPGLNLRRKYMQSETEKLMR